MKLLNLKLENFQGIKQTEFDFKGHSASIYGDNATGKTTVFNSVTWLLFDKASTGAKSYTPKTKGPEGDLHYLQHSAEAAFKTEAGRIIVLKKIFHENYKKKRGSNEEVLDGNTSDYFINGVQTSEKEYQATMLKFCGDIEKMKMLTMPTYFPEDMKWEARREILLEICGDITDQDVINQTKSLKDLPQYLLMPGTTDQYYDVDEYKKIAAAKKADINKQIQDIPGRIDEAQRATPDTTGIDTEAISKKIEKLSQQKEQLEAEKNQSLNGDQASASIRNKISELNVKLAEARAAYATTSSGINEGTYTAINNIKKVQMESKSQLQDYKNDLRNSEYRLKDLNDKRDKLLEDYKIVQSEKWDDSKSVCPTCHRELPEEEIEKTKQDFNQRKSSRLEDINIRGQKEASKTMIVEEANKITELKDKIFKEEQSITDYDQQIEALKNTLKAPQPFESTKKYTNYSEQIQNLRMDEQNKSVYTSKIIEGFNSQINGLQNEIKQQEELKTRIAIAEGQEKRIADLKAREKELSKQYEALESGIYLCELFIKAKVDLLTDKINSKFQNVRFRLFIEQQNGGVKPDCEVMIPAEGGRMVPFTIANNAARINAGLEIINILSTHWNIAMPVFVDNAEGVQKIINMNTQIIQLIVPLTWDKLGEVVKEALTKEYGSEELARTAYETPNKKLRLEINNEY